MTGVGVTPFRSAMSDVDAVGREDLDDAALRRLRERVRVHAEEERAVDALAAR